MIKRTIAFLAIILATGGAMFYATSPAEAKPTPKPKKISTFYRAAEPVHIDAPSQVGGSALIGLLFWNTHTLTDFNCNLDVNANCAPAPCPDSTRCLAIRMTSSGLAGDDATLRMLDAKRGLLLINQDGPLYNPDTVGSYTPWHRGALLTHWMGRFIGLPTNYTAGCTTVMSPRSWRCAPPRPGVTWLTAAEISQANAW